jgi:DNA-binding transcriptional ArsR family regulator
MGHDPNKLAEQQANICSVFSNPRRIMILWALIGRELSVSEIATTIKASLQNTSHHLTLMKNKGILSAHRDGQSVHYRIVQPELVNGLICKAPTYLSGLSTSNNDDPIIE